MRGRKEDVPGLGVDEGARRLARAWRDARDRPRLHIHQIDLIERIARFALALEDELSTVLRPVALAGPAPLDRQPANTGQKIPLGWLSLGPHHPADAGRHNGGHENEESSRASTLH